MNPRLTIPALLLPFSVAQAMVYPLDLYLPAPNFKDSVSMRQVRSGITTSRLDYAPGASRGTIRSSDVRGISTGDIGLDSASIHIEWDSRIPSVGPGLYDGSSGFTRTLYLGGTAPLFDSSWTIWDPDTRTLVRHSSTDRNCPWTDSIVFDDHNRLVLQKGCIEEEFDEEGNLIAPRSFDTYQAWFESPADTLPRRASRRSESMLRDSVASFGPANRPDSLDVGSTIVLVRNAQGKVVAVEFPSDTTRFEYDASNRLTREYTTESEIQYVYSWADPVGIRQGEARTSNRIRFGSGGLHFDLPAPEPVRIDRISRDGKRLGVLVEQNLSAGRTFLPISVKAGDLVRVESASRTTILVAPPR